MLIDFYRKALVLLGRTLIENQSKWTVDNLRKFSLYHIVQWTSVTVWRRDVLPQSQCGGVMSYFSHSVEAWCPTSVTVWRRDVLLQSQCGGVMSYFSHSVEAWCLTSVTVWRRGVLLPTCSQQAAPVTVSRHSHFVHQRRSNVCYKDDNVVTCLLSSPDVL